ncbi:MAG: TonB-dependent receptor [Bernardetiaceae bacterium]|jgi:hemoglobin/transferrin/lactoferrin receptor protein|nr:TonB-dependent receptor [Bernardetiaceae bacterium]
MKYLIIIFLINSLTLLAVAPLAAQQIKVLERTALRPVADVLVTNRAQTRNVVTGARGEANLAAFADGDTLVFTHVGYQTLVLAKSQLTDQQAVLMTEKVINLEEVVFSANRAEELRSDLPQKIETVTARQIAFNNPQTSGDLLRQTGNVFVQMSQAGGGSPVLRGFEASRVLLVVDGVRLNNAIYRTGHLQNVITIDPNMLAKVETVFGPGSVIYGSDALGGVMHFFTRDPEFSTNGKLLATGGAYTRYSTANHERTGSLQLSLAGRKFGSFTSVTHKTFGDVRAGSVRPRGYPNIWERRFTQSRDAQGRDVALPNDDVNQQTLSAYTQYDLLQKFVYKPHADNIFSINLQYSNSGEVPRYDRYSEANAAGLPSWARWDYGPQTRFLGIAKAEFLGQTEFYDRANVALGYQYVYESRITRRWAAPQETNREETVRVFSVNADLQKDLAPGHELRYGLEVAHNNVQSTAFNLNVQTGARTGASTRYPDGGSEMQSFAAYTTYAWEIGKPKKLIFSSGLRYNYVSLTAAFIEKVFFPFPFETAEQRNGALTGNLGLVYNPSPAWRLAFIGSSGFRSPNVDDLGRVFDSQPGNVIVPNPNIQPEYTYNLDLTIARNFDQKVWLELTGFHTWYRNAIAPRPFQFNGQDSILYDRVRSRVVANQNVQSAIVTGFQASAKAQLARFVWLQSNLTYTYGWVNSDNQPLDHVPPLFGQTSLRGEFKKLRVELWSQYNGWKRLKDYSPSGEDNLQYATPDGMPAWWTLNVRAAYQFNRFGQVQLALDNLLDRHYRYFSSGVSAPGRNLSVTLRGNF